MSIRGAQYTWAPDSQYINVSATLSLSLLVPHECLPTTQLTQLCSSGPTPQFLARISRGDDTVAIELTADALQLGLLDTIVVVAVLLQCGHNID